MPKLKDLFKKKDKGADDKEKAGFLQQAKEKAMLVLFAPFAVMARIFLQRRGIKPADNLRDLVIQVYNEKNKNSFGLSDVASDAFDYYSDPDEQGVIDVLTAQDSFNYGLIPITPEMVSIVIQFLKGVFDTIKKKKAAGVALSPDEQKIADEAPQLEADLDAAKKGAAEINDKAEAEVSGGFNWKMILGLVLLLVLIIWFIRK